MKFVYLILLLLNLRTYGLMVRDKYYAIKGKWRTPEKQLLYQALFFGSLGILLASLPPLRHKKNDTQFKAIALACLIGQLLLIGGLFFYFQHTI